MSAASSSDSTFRPLPLQSLGIILSYQCTNRCRHCLYSCSPRAREWMTIETLEAICDQLVHYRPTLRSIHLAGGEPFLRFDFLVQAVEMLNRYRLPLAYVETNAYWATSDQVARRKLEALRKAGLRAILISVSPFHAEFIPFERTERAIRIAEEVFGPWGVLLFTAEFYHHLKSLGLHGKLPFEEYRKLVPPVWLAGQIRSHYQFVPNGRGVFQLQDLFPALPARTFLSCSCRNELSYPNHVHIDLYGNYIGGLCAGISVGKAFDLSQLFEAGSDLEERPYLRLMTEENLGQALRWVQERTGFQPSERGYIAKCHLCADLRRCLFQHGLRTPDLSPPEFYLYLDA
ncbi:MAG: radical SAM protein [candidate division KSB1 bacterium]|nr:radical SAM protein [candidate division KSB1 bacterium]